MILYAPLAIALSNTAKFVDYGIPVVSNLSFNGAVASNRYRQRDFGVGYGNSSGYASGRSYTDRGAQSYFRCG